MANTILAALFGWTALLLGYLNVSCLRTQHLWSANTDVVETLVRLTPMQS